MVHPTRRLTTAMPAIAIGDFATPDLPDAVSLLNVCDALDPSADVVEDELEVEVEVEVEVAVEV